MSMLIIISVLITLAVTAIVAAAVGHLVGVSKAELKIINFVRENPSSEKLAMLNRLYPNEKEFFQAMVPPGYCYYPNCVCPSDKPQCDVYVRDN